MPSAAYRCSYRAGHPHPALAADVLQGLINTAVAAMDAGEPVHRTVRVTVAAVLDGFAPAPG